MRRLAALLVVLLSVPVAAAGTNPRDEQERLNTADTARAQRATLQAGDLGPGWVRAPVSSEDDETMRCPGWNPDFSSFTITGKAVSAFANAGGASVVSGVEVYANRSHALGDFRTGARPQLAACLRSSLGQQFRRSGVDAKVLSSRVVAAPRVGEHSAAYRAVVRVRANGMAIRVTMDFLVLHRGRTLASLLFSGAYRPFPAQRELARLVASRMR